MSCFLTDSHERGGGRGGGGANEADTNNDSRSWGGHVSDEIFSMHVSWIANSRNSNRAELGLTSSRGLEDSRLEPRGGNLKTKFGSPYLHIWGSSEFLVGEISSGLVNGYLFCSPFEKGSTR
ncbi:hypothetical protein R1flu_024505 [Riccia fluitans]|uniref:Uncharacterized protein n=1 Tax=Riccia fluitans TaxID=41844 RepID=A0ABD1XVZ7_9MARC